MPIPAQAFFHPEDQKALDSLKAIPLFPSCVKMFMKVVSEQYLHGISMAQKIRLGPNQLPNLYDHLPPICEFFGIEEPEFYLEMNPFPNAYTQGDFRLFITITSGLVEYLEEEELQTVIAHECGHIVCRHVLYHTMAHMLARYGPSLFGPLAHLSTPVRLALQYWSRRSEFSADRAAAAYAGATKPFVDTMIRLAGGPKSITNNINLDQYLKQAEAYDQLQDSHWDKLLQGMAVLDHSHPFLSVRTKEIMAWGESDGFQQILQEREVLRMSSQRPSSFHAYS